MSLDDRTPQQKLTPEERRALLRAYADRMLLKVSAMDDPEDMPGVEKAVRVAAGIERIYYRCDRAEHHTPDPHKAEAERAVSKGEAIRARVNLANTLEWSEKRRQHLGKWWDAAETSALATVQTAAPRPLSQTIPTAQASAPYEHRKSIPVKAFDKMFETPSQTPPEDLVTPDHILKTLATMARGDISEDAFDAYEKELDDWLQDRPPPS